MPPVEPHPVRNDATAAQDIPWWIDPDGAAREAARRAIARAAQERDADERHAEASDDARRTFRRPAAGEHRPARRWTTVVTAGLVLMLGAGTVSVAVRGGATRDGDVPDRAGVQAARVDDATAGDAPSTSVTAERREDAEPAAATAEAPYHGAVYEHGHVTLRGRVPTRAMADALYAKAVAVVGAANVTDEYVVDPSAPADVDGRVRIADQVLFRTGSAELDPGYAALLDAGVVLMVRNPDVVLQVVGHTDDVGSAESNQVLSVARAQAVVDYVQAKGGFAPARFLIEGAGETQPVADNSTAEGRRANRRIEVTILGLLAPSHG